MRYLKRINDGSEFKQYYKIFDCGQIKFEKIINNLQQIIYNNKLNV